MTYSYFYEKIGDLLYFLQLNQGLYYGFNFFIFSSITGTSIKILNTGFLQKLSFLVTY